MLHVVSAVTEHGRLGLTAVGEDLDDAWELHERAREGRVEHARRLA